MMISRIIILASILFSSACFVDTKSVESNKMTCRKNSDCINGKLCVEPQNICMIPNQCIQNDNGHSRSVEDGNSCDFKKDKKGLCISGLCLASTCGDGFIDSKLNEECDDGNTNNNDACTNTCIKAFCGDGFVFEGSEVCDGEGCNSDCEKKQVCGDGFIDDNEECDDKNLNDNDSCDTNCSVVKWNHNLILGKGPNKGQPNGVVWNGLGDLTFDLNGNLFILDETQHAVKKLTPQGEIFTVVGGNGYGYTGDNGPGFSAQLNQPQSLFVDTTGDLYIVDTLNRVVRLLSQDGKISTFLSSEMLRWKDHQDDLRNNFVPTYMEIDSSDDIYISTQKNLLKINQNKEVENLFTFNSPRDDRGSLFHNGIERFQRVGNTFFILAEGSMFRLDNQELCVIGKFDIAENNTADDNGEISPQSQQQQWLEEIGHCPEYAFSSLGNLLINGMLVLENEDILLSDSTRGRILQLQKHVGIKHIAGKPNNIFDTNENANGPVPALEDFLLSPSHIILDDEQHIYFIDGLNNAIKKIDENNFIEKISSWSQIGVKSEGRAIQNLNLKEILEVEMYNEELYLLGQNYLGKIQDGVFKTVLGSDRGGHFYKEGALAAESRMFFLLDYTVSENGIVFVSDGENVFRIGADGILKILKVRIPTVEGQGEAKAPFFYRLANSGHNTIYGVDYISEQWIEFDLQGRFIKQIAGGVENTIIEANHPASASKIDFISDIKIFDQEVYFIDSPTHSIKKIDRNGIIRLVAGQNDSATSGYAGDGGLAVDAYLNSPTKLVFDDLGNLLFSDINNNAIRKISSNGYISTIYGGLTDQKVGDGGLASLAQINYPSHLMIDAEGQILFREEEEYIRVIDANGMVKSYAGSYSDVNDGDFSVVELGGASSLAQLSNGNFLVTSGVEGLVRFVDMEQRKTSAVVGYPNYQLDEDSEKTLTQKALYSRELRNASGIAYVSTRDAFWITELEGNTIRELKKHGSNNPKDWSIETIGGITSVEKCCAHIQSDPLCVDPQTPPKGCEVYPEAFTDQVFLKYARFNAPSAISYDTSNNVVYIADRDNHVIRKVDVNSMYVTTVAGIPQQSGDLGNQPTKGLESRLSKPQGLAVAYDRSKRAHSLYISDTNNNKIRRLDLTTQIMTTVLGDGDASSSGRGKPAQYYPVNQPKGLVIDNYGNLYISSKTTIRQILSGSDGIADGNDEVDTIYGHGPRESLVEKSASCLSGLTLDKDQSKNTLYVLDECRGYLFQVYKN